MVPAELIKNLQETVAKFQGTQSEVTALKGTITSLEDRIDEMSVRQTLSPGQLRELGEWDSEKQAKNFVDYMKDLSQGTHTKVLDTVASAGADGGNLVPEEFRATLLRLIDVFGFVRRTARRIPMSTDTMIMPTLTGTVTVDWPAQNTAITASAPTFGQVTLTVAKMAVLVGSSTEMLEDSSIGVANLLATIVAEQIAREEDRVGLVGDSGSDAFDGIINTTGVNQVIMATGQDTYAEVTAEDLLDMITATPSPALSGARFVMHRSVFDAVRKLKTSGGDYIFSRPGLEAGTSGTIWGYPFSLSDLMPDTSVATQLSTDFLIFGNMLNLYMPDRRRLTAAVSTHIGFKEDQVWYRWTQRIGFLVPLPTTFTKLTTSAT